MENIVCEGFAVEAFARMTNDHGQDMNDVLEFIGEDIPKYRGFALIVQYGGDLKPKAVYPVPFGYVRAVLNKTIKTIVALTSGWYSIIGTVPPSRTPTARRAQYTQHSTRITLQRNVRNMEVSKSPGATVLQQLV